MNIIVTGASSGIGYEVVKCFAKNKGYKIFAIARRTELLKKLCEECAIYEGEVIPFSFDLISGTYINLQNAIEKSFQKVDILLNNAGLLINKPFLKMTENEVDELIESNFKSIVKMTQTVLPLMNGSNSHIINISSMSGFQGSSKFAGLSIYSATKSAIASLSEVLAEELKPIGVSVNCLALGAVQTEMFEKAFPGAGAQMSLTHLADFIADFCLNGNKYFNGKILPVTLSTP
jgi:short-subunit dehydrogenase